MPLTSVLIPVAVDRPYTYASDRALAPGTIVAVPLGTRLTLGAVWPAPPDEVAPKKLREIEQILDAPPLPEVLVRFADWVADYTLSPRGMILRMILRSPQALEPEKPIVGVRVSGSPPDRLTAARKRVLDGAADGLAWSKSGLAAAAGRGGTRSGISPAAAHGGADSRGQLPA